MKHPMKKGGTGQTDASTVPKSSGGSLAGMNTMADKKAGGDMGALKRVAGGAVDRPPKTRV